MKCLTNLLFILMAVSTPSWGWQEKRTSSPHIVFIIADDLGWDDVSFHGSQQIPTPNIDALAYTGVILNNYYVQPICTPTRSALLTARHPIHTGMQHSVIFGSEPYGLGLNETLLPQYLKRLGYATHAVGKWHLGFFAKEYTPTFRGFDSHFGYWVGAEDYWDHTMRTVYEKKAYTGLDFHDALKDVEDEAGHYSTEVFTSKAQDVINKHNSSQPLFLYLAHQAVHSSNGGRAPLQAPEEYIKRFSHIQDENRRVFAAMTAVLDESVGNVAKTLHEKGMLENSIIMFTTDNGGPAAGFDGNWACNWPLRGRKASVWEGGTRGAGFIWSPMLNATNSVSNQLMQVTDWMPTILSAVGHDSSNLPADLDGMDMWGAINNPESPSPRKELLYNIDPKSGSYALRVGNYKLVTETASTDWYSCPGISQFGNNGKEVRMDMESKLHGEKAPRDMFNSQLYSILTDLGLSLKENKPVVVDCGPKPANASSNCQSHIAPCLYNLSSDPCEYNNLAAQKPEVLQQLLERLRSYNTSAVPPRNVPQDPKGLPTYHHNAWEPWVQL